MRIPLLVIAAGLGACTDAERCKQPGDICLFAGVPGEARVSPEAEPPKASNFYLPQDLTVAPDGRPYLIDFNAHRIRRVDEDGLVRTVLGTGFLGDGPEGSALDFSMNHPTDLAFHPDDPELLYVAAWHNSRVNVVDLRTGSARFECGTGARSFGGDGGHAAEAVLDLPSSLAFDDQGGFYISDQANQLVRYVDADGVITTVAGQQRVTGYDEGELPALEARFHGAVGQAADPSSRLTWHDGLVYLADTENQVIRVFDPASGTVRTIAGTGTVAGASGDGGPATQATLNRPRDVEVAEDGTVYIADTDNHCVRRITLDGVIETVAGVCGSFGYDVDGGPATEALLHFPYGIELDGDTLYIADTHNHVFRKVLLQD